MSTTDQDSEREKNRLPWVYRALEFPPPPLDTNHRLKEIAELDSSFIAGRFEGEEVSQVYLPPLI